MEKYATLDSVQSGLVGYISSTLEAFNRFLAGYNGSQELVNTILDRGYINQSSASFYYGLGTKAQEVHGEYELMDARSHEDVYKAIKPYVSFGKSADVYTNNNTSDYKFGMWITGTDNGKLSDLCSSTSKYQDSRVLMVNYLTKEVFKHWLESGLIYSTEDAFNKLYAGAASNDVGLRCAAFCIDVRNLCNFITSTVAYKIGNEDNRASDDRGVLYPVTSKPFLLYTIYDKKTLEVNLSRTYFLERVNLAAILRSSPLTGDNLLIDDQAYIMCAETNSVWVAARAISSVRQFTNIRAIECMCECTKFFAQMAEDFSHASFATYDSVASMKNWLFNYIQANAPSQCFGSNVLSKSTWSSTLNTFLKLL